MHLRAAALFIRETRSGNEVDYHLEVSGEVTFNGEEYDVKLDPRQDIDGRGEVDIAERVLMEAFDAAVLPYAVEEAA